MHGAGVGWGGPAPPGPALLCWAVVSSLRAAPEAGSGPARGEAGLLGGEQRVRGLPLAW